MARGVVHSIKESEVYPNPSENLAMSSVMFYAEGTISERRPSILYQFAQILMLGQTCNDPGLAGLAVNEVSDFRQNVGSKHLVAGCHWIEAAHSSTHPGIAAVGCSCNMRRCRPVPGFFGLFKKHVSMGFLVASVELCW